MEAGNNIARTIMTWMVAFATSALFLVAPAAMAKPVRVFVEDGETSFILDVDKDEIWWITDQCRYEVPVETSDDKSKASKDIMSSDRFLKDVQIGSHRFTLEQQFRFNMVSPTPSLEIYNSARGGWSKIDIRIENACDADLSCRRAMELPLCTD